MNKTSTRLNARLTQSVLGLGAAMLGATALSNPALAQTVTAQPNAARPTSASTAATIQTLSQELKSLQAQINELKSTQTQQAQVQATVQTQVAQQSVAVAQAETEAKVATAGYKKKIGGVTITPGGFIEAAEIYRSRNETTSIGSNFNTGIPLPNSANYRTSEYRSSVQQSRLSLLAQGDYDDNIRLSGYYEADFISAAPTANSNESNSYNLRMRLAYATADIQNMGLHLLAGQAWSLATMNKVGLDPRQVSNPLQIDAQYVVGYNWARQTAVRATYDVTPWAHVGVSVEEPQTVYTGTDPAGTIVNNSGNSQLDPSATYSSDVAPDLIAKLAIDPGWGHYEVYGLARWMHDQSGLTTGTTGAGKNNTVTAGGIGGGAIIPIVPKVIDFQISGLFGTGIGRYGSAGLPDATVSSTGAPKPIREAEAMVGLVAHPLPQIDLYGYGGIEQSHRTANALVGATVYGYGNPAQNNTGCWEIGGACAGQTSAVRELTFGGWYRFYKGSYGMAEFGVQDAEFYRNTFTGKGGAPHTNMNVLMTSIRYYPF